MKLSSFCGIAILSCACYASNLRKIWLDTDIGGDFDDIVALRMLAEKHQQGAIAPAHRAQQGGGRADGGIPPSAAGAGTQRDPGAAAGAGS